MGGWGEDSRGENMSAQKTAFSWRTTRKRSTSVKAAQLLMRYNLRNTM